jgi:hypothetical protein
MLVNGSVNHFRDFQDIAKELVHYWILVRSTNIHSLAYIGKKANYEYAPKRIDCKAKTASGDVPGKPWQLKGLVVSPEIHPAAFENLVEAKKCWSKMNISQMPGRNGGYYYSLDKDMNSEHYGCVMFNGKYIHGDYDLYDVVDIRQPQRNLALVGKLHGTDHLAGANLRIVQQAINTRLGIDMIQHGGEAQFQLHREQKIDAFNPRGEHIQIQNLSELRELYRTTFQGRITLADRFPQPGHINHDIKVGDYNNVTPISVHKKYKGFKW